MELVSYQGGQRCTIDGCIAIGASDAGIYVGQPENIVVRNSIAKFTLQALRSKIYYADVYDNTAEDNTGGILVFDLPGLPQQGGHDVRVFNNSIVHNNTDNFAPEILAKSLEERELSSWQIQMLRFLAIESMIMKQLVLLSLAISIDDSDDFDSITHIQSQPRYIIMRLVDQAVSRFR